jgi:hypothetical protein
MNFNNKKNKHNFTEKSMKTRFLNDRLEVWINSFGGVYSNFMYDMLHNSGINVNSSGYHLKGCHYIRPISNINKRFFKCAFFLYNEDIRMALTSQINRNFMYRNFCKLFPAPDYNNKSVIQSLKNMGCFNDKSRCILNNNITSPLYKWLKLINIQIDNWTTNGSIDSNRNYKIVIINMNKLDENKEKLLKYIINNVCSRNGYLTSKQVQSVVKLNKLFHPTTGKIGEIDANRIIKDRKTKEYHSRLLDEHLLENERELIDIIDKKLIDLPDFKIL